MKTINHLIAGSCTKYADRPALAMAFEEAMTYGQMEDAIRRTAYALLDAGVKRGDPVAILAENSPNWGIAYLATVRLGGIVVPILPDFPEADIHHILKASASKVLFTTTRQVEKIFELSVHPRQIILLDDTDIHNPPISLMTFGQFLHKGKENAEKLATLAGRVKSDDIAAIIYTSGTSGHSKAVMLTHNNLVSNVESAQQVVSLSAAYIFLSLLPLSHTYEFTCGFLLPVSCGSKVVYAGARPTPTMLQKICHHEKPWAMCVVPMILEKIYKKKVIPEITGKWFLRTALRLPGLRNKIYQVIGSKLKDFFGGNLALLAVGGAALNREAEEFFRRINFPLLVGYGLTESSPMLAGGPYGDHTIATGSCGKPMPGVEIKIVNPHKETGIGEIFARGPNIMTGYFENKALTEETIDADGWLTTGDLGYLDGSNNLFVVGRSKSVIVLSHGENIYPEAVEDKLNSYPCVAESLLVARDDRLEGMIYPDYEYVDSQTKGKGEEVKRGLLATRFEEMRREVNASLPQYSQIRKIVERQDPFIKTATHKIKRYLYT